MALVATGLATHIFNNHLKSALLLAGFPLLLLLMLFAFSAALGMSMPAVVPSLDTAVQAGWQGVLRYGHFMIGAAAIWFLIAFFFHGRMMSAAANSHPITRAEMPRIYNLLENLCIARGIPMPSFEVIDSPALNAFAAGLSEKNYKIVLTRGIIEALDDEELEAVIAHELSHILNRDVRLLVISVIFVGMISFVAEMVFRGLVYGRRPNLYTRGNNQNQTGGLVIMLLAMAILAVGYIFAIAIRFALSRKREFLADAGAVELTKNPEAMMRALLRISGHDKMQGMPAEVAQMCIENSQPFMGLFATHPPIDERVAVLARMTGTPVPDHLPVSLRRPPKKPWVKGPWGGG